jgi:hypothetical protein
MGFIVKKSARNTKFKVQGLHKMARRISHSSHLLHHLPQTQDTQDFDIHLTASPCITG